MRREKQVRPGFFHMGTISLLVVLLVVILVVMSLMMLADARQDYDYSVKLAQRKTMYYEANNQAQRIHQQVRVQLEQEEPDFTDLPVTVKDDEISWQVPLSEKQVLKAVLTNQQGRWVITCWQVE